MTQDQHRVRAQLLRDGQRTLAAATITDYRAATYATAVDIESRRVHNEFIKDRDAAADKELFGTPTTSGPTPTGMEAIDELLLAIYNDTDRPVPATPKQALLDRLNARLAA